MLLTVCVTLSLLCGVLGVMFLAFPRTLMRVADSVDREYSTEGLRSRLDKEISTEKFRELLDRNITIGGQNVRFYRSVGLVSLVVGIILFGTSPSLVCVTLSRLCGVLGVMFLAFPRTLMRVATVMDREYSTEDLRRKLDQEISTEKLYGMLDRNIDPGLQQVGFYRFVGVASLFVGIILLAASFSNL